MTGSPRVLIVDDVRDNREVYAEYLRYRRFSVTEAATGAEALAAVRQHDPHAVLLDMRLPDLEGTEVCRRIRQMPDRNPAIIAVSAGVANSEIDTALANGCAVFLTKPCLPEALEAEIRRILDMSAEV